MVWRDVSGFDTVARIANRLSRIDRYDLLLGLIPTALTAAAVVGSVLELPTEATLLGGVAIALIALLDGLFFRPPTGLGGT